MNTITATTPGQAIAKWWAEQLGAPTFDNGDKSEAGDMASILATMISVQAGGVTEAQSAKFVELLSERVDESLRKQSEYGNDYTRRVTLGTDYGPEYALADAAREAGIPASRFPWKTMTRATLDHVVVSPGYGASNRLIWSAPGWERGQCESRRYNEETWEQLPEVCGLERYHDEREHGAWLPREVTR